MEKEKSSVHYSLIELRAENFKRLVAVTIRPKSSVVEIKGKNAQGKTSVIDALWAALGGKKAAPKKPIREGEKEASIILNFGDFSVERVFTEKNSYLRIKPKEIHEGEGPQEFLDRIIGTPLSFDPVKFANDPTTAKKTILEMARLPFDLDDLATERACFYSDRTTQNGEAKRLQAHVDSLDVDPSETPRDVPEAGELMRERDRLDATIEEFDATSTRRDDLMAKKAAFLKQIEHIDDEILNATESLDNQGPAVVEARDRIAEIEDEITSTSEVIARNKVVEDAIESRQEITIHEQKAAACTDAIKRIDRRKQVGLQNAKLPVEGLGFNDADDLTYNDVPVTECSSSERLLLGMAIAMSHDAPLKIIKIEDGSLLDEDSMAYVKEMADENGYTVLIERVGTAGEGGIIIEDGEVAA